MKLVIGRNERTKLTKNYGSFHFSSSVLSYIQLLIMHASGFVFNVALESFEGHTLIRSEIIGML